MLLKEIRKEKSPRSWPEQLDGGGAIEGMGVQ